MYECGLRLGTEMFTAEGLRRQAKSYLACLNCLKLVHPKYAWIVKPVPYSSVNSFDGASPKRSHDGSELPSSDENRSRPEMEVLEYKDIEKEFELVSARLQLIKRGSLPSGPGLSPSECVSLLIAANLYEDAVKIAQLYSLDFRPILEGLATKCVQLSRSTLHRNSAWDWLALNNPNTIRSASSVPEVALELLKSLLERLEIKGQSSLHKAVSIRFFNQAASLPAWLENSYKMV